MIDQKRVIIENLTGVNSSKLNYYLELKKRNEEIIKQNSWLAIIHQLVKDINIDMSISDIIHRTYKQLPSVLPCDFLVLALLEGDSLYMKTMVPGNECLNQEITRHSLLWDSINQLEYKLHSFDSEGGSSFQKICNCQSINKNSHIGSLVTIPLFVRQKVIGVLAVGSHDSNAYAESELNFCQHLADQLAICIENARLYEQVWRGKREWEQTFAAVIDPIYLIDLQFNVIRNNNRTTPFSCTQAQSNGGGKCYQLLWGKNNKCKDCLIEVVLKTGKPAQRRIQTSGYTLDVYYYPAYNDENEIYAVIHHIQDVTEKIKMEAKLIQSDKLAAVGEMAAGVAHEINNPMTVIIGTAQIMLRELPQQHPHSEYLDDIVNSGLRCKKIVQNLLTFSRQEQQPMVPTDINEQVQNVLSLSKYQINRNRITINTKLAENLPTVTANAQQLQQVLINLLLNARDALEIRPAKRCININTYLDQGEQGERLVCLSVTDNGAGIKKDDIHKIFNPFFTNKETLKGTGLGLAVSLGIAQAHDGIIKVSSKPGEGSIFSLVLPASQ